MGAKPEAGGVEELELHAARFVSEQDKSHEGAAPSNCSPPPKNADMISKAKRPPAKPGGAAKRKAAAAKPLANEDKSLAGGVEEKRPSKEDTSHKGGAAKPKAKGKVAPRVDFA